MIAIVVGEPLLLAMLDHHSMQLLHNYFNNRWEAVNVGDVGSQIHEVSAQVLQ